MVKKRLELKVIQTNHKLEDAKYTVINGVRTQTGNIEGVELQQSNILFTYLGRNYFLIDDKVYNEQNICLLQNYKRHFEKDGKLYLESLNNALYKIEKNAPVLQQHKYNLYGEQQTFYNSLTKKNIPFMGTDEEISYINSIGQVYLINLKERYYWTMSNDGKKLDKFSLIKQLKLEKVFFILAQKGIEIICFDNQELIHYQILENELIELVKFNSPTRPIQIDYVNKKLIAVFENNKEIYYQELGTEEKYILSENFTIIKNNIANKLEEKKVIYNKIEIVKNEYVKINITRFDTKYIWTYKESNTQEKLQQYFVSTFEESNNIVVINNNKIISYKEIDLGITENKYQFKNRQVIKVIGTKTFQYGNNHNTQWYETKPVNGKLTETFYQVGQERKNTILSVISVFNLLTKKWETIQIEIKYPQNHGVNYKKAYVNLSSEVVTIDYETYITEEADNKDYNRNRLILTNPNYPLTKDLTSYLLEEIDVNKLIEVQKSYINWEYKAGQEHLIHNFDFKSESLEFMNGNIYLSKYNNLVINYYPKKPLFSPYEGEKSLILIAKDFNEIESWRMYSPPIAYYKNILCFCMELGEDKFEIRPNPLPKIKSFSTGGANTFVVLQNDTTSVQIRSHSKKIDYNFISVDDEIEEIEATKQGTFIGCTTSLKYLKAIPTGNQVSLYQETIKFDHVVKNIGKELIFFYGNGIISYVRDNELVRELWKLNLNPTLAMVKNNNIIIKTEDLKLWILTRATGEIAYLKTENTLNLDYKITDEKGQGYYLRQYANPTLAIEWKQSKLMRLRSIESYSEIVKARFNNTSGGISRRHNLFIANLRGVIREGQVLEITFNKKIAKDIIVNTY